MSISLPGQKLTQKHPPFTHPSPPAVPATHKWTQTQICIRGWSWLMEPRGAERVGGGGSRGAGVNRCQQIKARELPNMRYCTWIDGCFIWSTEPGGMGVWHSSRFDYSGVQNNGQQRKRKVFAFVFFWQLAISWRFDPCTNKFENNQMPLDVS